MLGGPQSLSGLSAEEENRSSLTGIERCFIDRSARSLVAIPTDPAAQAICGRTIG
jgi:hypothetical protein